MSQLDDIERKIDMLLTLLPLRNCGPNPSQPHVHGFEAFSYPMLRAWEEPLPGCVVYENDRVVFLYEKASV